VWTFELRTAYFSFFIVSTMKSSGHVGSLGNVVVALVIIAVAGLTLNMRMTRVLSLDGSQQVKAKPSSTHDANWALEIAGNAAAAFRLEMEHGNDDDNDDIDDTLLSVPSQSPQVEVTGISELMEYSFWAKNGFCKMIHNLTVVPEANMNMSSSSSQLRPSTQQQHQPPTLPVVVNFTFGCKELFKSSVLGTGNWLSSF
jgi:hypothetical protein